jgi:hypothetical protein
MTDTSHFPQDSPKDICEAERLGSEQPLAEARPYLSSEKGHMQSNDPLRIYAWRGHTALMSVAIAVCVALACMAVSVFSYLPNDFRIPDLVVGCLLAISALWLTVNFRRYTCHQVEVYADRLVVRGGNRKVKLSVRYASITAYTTWTSRFGAGLILHTVHGPVTISAGIENVDDLSREIDRRLHYTEAFSLNSVA